MTKMDIKESINNRVEWIKQLLASTGAKGVVYGNSGGKDCTLVGALCKLATDNVLGVIMPCNSTVNYGQDRDDALKAGNFYNIQQIEVDLSKTKDALIDAFKDNLDIDKASDHAKDMAIINCNPRLRMTTLYAIAQSKGYLVAGTGNKDELALGYFTKWGDGAHDFNPIADLTVREVYAHLRALDCPGSIITKAPSAGLFPGQTDEKELGIRYNDVDKYLDGEEINPDVQAKIEKSIKGAMHKHSMPLHFQENK